jgi:cell division protease FtsH
LKKRRNRRPASSLSTNQLLVEMDGFSVNEGIIILAATNRIDILDPALLRAGRFDRQIIVDVPDRQGRREILAVHAAGKPLADDVDFDSIAARTSGFTGADLANLLNEAALLSARRRVSRIRMQEIDDAYDRIVTGGPNKRRKLTEKEKERIAIHEAGHALVSVHLPHADPVRKVTIIGAGRALGYVQFEPKQDKNMHSRTEITERIAGLLAGRAAEEIFLGDVSTGAGNDLERATTLARRMVTELGMDEQLGPVRLGTPMPENPLFGVPVSRTVSEETASLVDDAVRRLIMEAYDRATACLKQNQETLRRIVRVLLERESISGDELQHLVSAGA